MIHLLPELVWKEAKQSKLVDGFHDGPHFATECDTFAWVCDHLVRNQENKRNAIDLATALLLDLLLFFKNAFIRLL